jgi:carboxyl-terminal processing protease
MKFFKKYALVFIIAGGSFGFLSYKVDDRYFEIAKNLDIFATMFKELNALYVDEINPNKAIRTGINAMLKDLDPYTNFYPEDDIEDYRTMSTGKYNGIGASVIRLNGKRVISMIYENSSADKEGLKIGDEVVQINGIGINDKDSEQIGRLLKGQSGSKADLKVKRYGESKMLSFQVERGVVKTPNVPHSGMINERVGYIFLNEFSASAANEVKKAFMDLKDEGMQELVLDLRGNPGGLLNMAIEISNFFIEKGSLVVETKGKVAEWNTKYYGKDKPLDTKIPIAVLISSSSASASEIVSGTIQDYDRGVIIGQRSFGKGLVQTTRPLSFNTQMKITTAKYYIPSGRCIQAIDYSNRNEDGSVGKVPDSLKTAFATANGRVFYDGGGVEPDIYTKSSELSPIMRALLKEGKVFDFATKYFYENPKASVDGKFTLSDAGYQKFISWLNAGDFNYKTKSEIDLEKFEIAAKSENLTEFIKSNLASIREAVEKSKQADLITFKNQIIRQLEDEIVIRYHYTNAAKFMSFESDVEVQQAISVFQDKSRYDKILSGVK